MGVENTEKVLAHESVIMFATCAKCHVGAGTAACACASLACDV